MKRAMPVVALCVLGSCSLEAPLPTGLIDPATAETPAGALSAYRGAFAPLRTALSAFVGSTGVLTDELQAADIGGPVGTLLNRMDIDSRALPEGHASDFQYLDLHRLRGQAREAIGLLSEYAPESSPALRGHLYALQGYAALMLAELYCSGISLSTLDYNGDYTLTPALSTEEVLTRAVALFDTALALSGDSARFLNLARVGRARALLGLGAVGEAGQAVAGVPDGYRYTVSYNAGPGAASATNLFFQTTTVGFRTTYTVADNEGGNGLNFISSGDPRTPVTINGNNDYGVRRHHPAPKYATTGASPITLADGVEARLIEAEAALQGAGGGWLTTLNALRTNGTFTTRPNASDPTRTDTLWNAGTGGVALLAPLGDPRDANSCLDLLFRERAFWLFLTGHRQGDLRRLIRYYGRDTETVYPTGLYPGANGNYGTDVTVPIPEDERAFNPLFQGCLSRGA